MDKDLARTEEDSTQDYYRGIQNVARAPQDKSVSSQFKSKKSIQGRRGKGENKKQQSQAKHRSRAGSQNRASSRPQRKSDKKRRTLRRVRKVAAIAGIFSSGIVFTLYLFLQLPFTLISFGGFGLQVLVENIQEKWYGALFKYFDIASFFPGELVGNAFLGLLILLSLGIFLGYLFWFHLIGIRPFQTALSFFIAATCLALNMFPPMSIFPWLFFWVLYVNITSLFSRQ